jgi:capsular polysaccharide biosynthesis protein
MKLPDLGLRQWTSELDWSPDWEIEGVHERGLGRGRVRFSGFTPKRISRALRKFDTGRHEEPELITLRDAVFLRRKRCLYRLDGSRIDETMWTWVDPDISTWPTLESKAMAMAEKHMPAHAEIPQRVKRIEQPVLYLGELKRHYGHFLTDGMARLWALDRMPVDAPAFFHLDPVDAMGVSHVGQVMEALGIPAERMIWPDQATVFSEILCPMPAIQLSVRAYDAFDRPHRWAAQALAGDLDRPSRPVYLSRRGLGEGHREIFGEEELEARLEAEGYLVVQPEKLTLTQQIALFDQDKPVVGPVGSALHTVLFRRRVRGQKLGVLTPPDVPGRFLLIDRVKANRTTYCNCMRELTEAESPIDVPLQQRSWKIDVERAMAQLDDAGFF